MSKVGIRELKQNASAVVAQAAAGEIVTITDRGRPVAQMTAIPTSRLEALRASGRLRPAQADIRDLPEPLALDIHPTLSEVLAQMREEERY
ncbi:MAG: type II toxin-antitoxin system prevent-host-death family antitoxin [Acidimicrobiia bacterium]